MHTTCFGMTLSLGAFGADINLAADLVQPAFQERPTS